MAVKNKLRYKNFNVCQLVIKGKMKLQYVDEFKESKKLHSKTMNAVDHVDKLHKHKNIDEFEFINNVDMLDESNFLLPNILDRTLNFEFVKKYCRFVEIQNIENDESYFTFFILNDLKLSIKDVFLKKNCNFIVLNEEEITPYLISFNMIKDEYTIDDLKVVFSKYLESKNEINKKLIK